MTSDRLARMVDILLQTTNHGHVVYLRGRNTFLHPLLPDVIRWLLSRNAWVDLEGDIKLQDTFYKNLLSNLPSNRFRVTLAADPIDSELREIALRSGQLADTGIPLRILIFNRPEDPQGTETFINFFQRLRKLIPFACSIIESPSGDQQEANTGSLAPMWECSGPALPVNFPDPAPKHNSEMGQNRYCCLGATALRIGPDGRYSGSFCAKSPQTRYLWEEERIKPQIIFCNEENCPDRLNSVLPKFASHTGAMQWFEDAIESCRCTEKAALPNLIGNPKQQEDRASLESYSDCTIIIITARNVDSISTLASALLPGKFTREIIFIYDDPALSERIRNFQPEFASALRTVFLPERRPLGAMFNLGLKMAGGKYITFAAGGDIFEIDALDHAIEHLEKENAAAIFLPDPGEAKAGHVTSSINLSDYHGLYKRASLAENRIEFFENDSFFAEPFNLQLYSSRLATIRLNQPLCHGIPRQKEENWLHDFASFIAWLAEETHHQNFQADEYDQYVDALFQRYKEEIFTSAQKRHVPDTYIHLASNSKFLNAILKDYALICRANKPPLTRRQISISLKEQRTIPSANCQVPLLSIVLRDCSDQSYLKESLSSIYDQSLPDMEIIIAASNNEGLIQDVVEYIANSGKVIRVIAAESLKEAAVLASGKYIVFAESGGVFTPGFFAIAIEAIAVNQAELAVFSSVGSASHPGTSLHDEEILDSKDAFYAFCEGKIDSSLDGRIFLGSYLKKFSYLLGQNGGEALFAALLANGAKVVLRPQIAYKRPAKEARLHADYEDALAHCEILLQTLMREYDASGLRENLSLASMPVSRFLEAELLDNYLAKLRANGQIDSDDFRNFCDQPLFAAALLNGWARQWPRGNNHKQEAPIPRKPAIPENPLATILIKWQPEMARLLAGFQLWNLEFIITNCPEDAYGNNSDDGRITRVLMDSQEFEPQNARGRYIAIGIPDEELLLQAMPVLECDQEIDFSLLSTRKSTPEKISSRDLFLEHYRGELLWNKAIIRRQFAIDNGLEPFSEMHLYEPDRLEIMSKTGRCLLMPAENDMASSRKQILHPREILALASKIDRFFAAHGDLEEFASFEFQKYFTELLLPLLGIENVLAQVTLPMPFPVGLLKICMENALACRKDTENFKRSLNPAGKPELTPIFNTDTTPLISIIIIGRNYAQGLDITLKSLANVESCEVILIDDCSDQDNTWEICYNHARANPDIRFFSSRTYSGTGTCRQLAIAETRGDFLMFLEPGDILEPEFLPQATSLISGRLDIVACSWRGAEDGEYFFGKCELDSANAVGDLLRSGFANILQAKLFRTDLFKRNPDLCIGSDPENSIILPALYSRANGVLKSGIVACEKTLPAPPKPCEIDLERALAELTRLREDLEERLHVPDLAREAIESFFRSHLNDILTWLASNDGDNTKAALATLCKSDVFVKELLGSIAKMSGSGKWDSSSS